MRSFVLRTAAEVLPSDLQRRPSGQPTVTALGWAADLAIELRTQLRTLLAETPAWRRARCAFVVSEDGVEVVERAEQAQHFARHGLRPLAHRIRQAPIGRACVVLLGDEVAILSVDPEWALAQGVSE